MSTGAPPSPPLSYPVTFDVARPDRYDRAHAVFRLLLLLLLSLVGSIVGWLFGVVYLGLPVAAAILVQQAGEGRYLEQEGDRVARWLCWLVAAYAYLLFLVDRFPSERPEELVRFDVRRSGRPTVGSALLRLLLSLPSAVVLAVLTLISAVVWLVSFVSVLVYEGVPRSLYAYQRGIVRWQARLLGYHASLVEEYPPFSLDTGSREE
jgi:hypothetical protein